METKAKNWGISLVFALLGMVIMTLMLLLGASLLVSRGIIPEDKMRLTVFIILILAAFVGGRILGGAGFVAPIVAGLIPAILFFAILFGISALLGRVEDILSTLPSLGALSLGGAISAILGARNHQYSKVKRP